jgi:hypothetical protein
MEDEELQSLVDKAKELEVWKEYFDAFVKSITPEIAKDILRDVIARAMRTADMAEELADMAEDLATRAKLVEHLRRTSELVEACMRETYMKGGSFSLPPITLNNSVTPSLIGNHRSVTIVNDNGVPKTVSLKIPKAKIKELKTNVWMDPDKVKIPFERKDKRLAPSALGSAYSAKGCRFTYANQFGVQNLVMAIVSDAISGRLNAYSFPISK